MSATYLCTFREQAGQRRVPITALALLALHRGRAVSQPAPTTAHHRPTPAAPSSINSLSERFMRPIGPAPRIPSSFSLAAARRGPNAGVGAVTSQGSSARPRVPLRRRAAGSGWRPRRRPPNPSPAPRAVRRPWAAAVAGGGAGSAGGERTKRAESTEPRLGQVSPCRLGRRGGTLGAGRELAGGQRDCTVPPLLAATGRGVRAAGASPCGGRARCPLPLARGPRGLSRKGRGFLYPSCRLLIGCV